MARPLKIEVFDKDFHWQGLVGDPIFVTVIPRHNTPGQATISVRANHRLIPALTAPGARLRFQDANGDFLMSGRIINFRGTGPKKRSLLEFDVVDDLAVLRHILGWVIPGAAITAQGTAGTNWVSTGPAETVLKAALVANGVERLALPIEVPASEGRGATVKASLRMQPLYEKLFPVEDGAGIGKAGIGVQMELIPDQGLRLNITTPQVRPQPLTEESGIIREWSFSYSAPTMTRGVVGGQGEGQLRLFREKADAALEAELGWKYETWRDGRDSNDPTELYSRLDESLLEGRAKAGISLSLGETKNFAYGTTGARVGDIVTINVAGQSFTETLQEATLSWTKDGGYESRPRVGDKQDDPDVRVVSAIKQIARSIMNRNTER